MKKKLACILLCLWMSPLFAGGVNKIVAFGDSLSDTGNLYEYMHRQLPMSPPYYQGRFTSGPVWVEHLARYYYANDALSHLSVYAFGGAGIDAEEEEEDDFIDGAMLTLKVQLDSYLLAHQEKADANVLYTVWMGANNYLGLPESPNEEVDLVISGIQGSVERLVERGAKHIMLLGLPDLGRTPMAKDFESEKELTDITHAHNERLLELHNVFQSKYPQVTWIFFDVDTLFNKALNSPKEYDYENVTGTCYDSFEYMPSSSQPILNMVSRVKPKLNQPLQSPVSGGDICDKFLFFDQVHPSGKAHLFISQEAIKLVEQAGIIFE